MDYWEGIRAFLKKQEQQNDPTIEGINALFERLLRNMGCTQVIGNCYRAAQTDTKNLQGEQAAHYCWHLKNSIENEWERKTGKQRFIKIRAIGVNVHTEVKCLFYTVPVSSGSTIVMYLPKLEAKRLECR